MTNRVPVAGEQQVRVSTMRHEALDIISVELIPYEASTLLPFTAGSHIDLHLPNGPTRSYSLMNPQGETHRYVLGIFRDPNSRGGSKYLHEQLRVGRVLSISAPRNNFPLAEHAEHHLFIAGGIGITPFCCMLERLNVLRRNWELHYCVRTRDRAAFTDRLEQLAASGRGRVEYNFDAEPGGVMLDIPQQLSGAPPDTHVYCCGPSGMLQAFQAASASRPAQHVHFEYFSSTQTPVLSGGFTVVLARSNKRVYIPPGNTILDVLLAEGIDVAYSCQEGICGACETVVLAGEPEHRDMILTDEQHSSNKVMMICCSGCKGKEITLDL